MERESDQRSKRERLLVRYELFRELDSTVRCMYGDAMHSQGKELWRRESERKNDGILYGECMAKPREIVKHALDGMAGKEGAKHRINTLYTCT